MTSAVIFGPVLYLTVSQGGFTYQEIRRRQTTHPGHTHTHIKNSCFFPVEQNWYTQKKNPTQT